SGAGHELRDAERGHGRHDPRSAPRPGVRQLGPWNWTAPGGRSTTRIVPRIEQCRERYLRSPRLSRREGGATLYVIAWEPDGERIVSYDVDLGGELREAARGPRHDAIPTLTPRLPPEPSEDPSDEDRAQDGGWRVEVRRV